MNIHKILKLTPVIPVLIIQRLEHAVPLAQALFQGGLSVLEVTLRTPVALDAITAMRTAVPEAIIGAGTVTVPTDIQTVADAGAQFAVSPGLTSALAHAAHAAALPLLPGVMTPTEIITARTLGFTALKLFPAQQAGGIGMLKALASPFADVVFCPTGGITRATAAEYLALSNVACVGGSWVAPQGHIHNGDWSAIETLAKDAAALGQCSL